MKTNNHSHKNNLLKKFNMESGIIRNKIILIVISVCFMISIIFVTLSLCDGAADRRKASKLSQNVEKEIDRIKVDVPNMDRDAFVTVEDKVVVGFVEFPKNNTRYPIINIFDKNTYSSSFCRQGSDMPWDIEGMTIYGIKSFTKELDGITDGFEMIFEDLSGEKYHYQFQKDSKEKVIDYGIRIYTVDKDGNEKESFQFVRS